MNILFVYPNQGGFGTKPLGISLLVAILRREGHNVSIFDTSFIDLGGNDYNDDLTKYGYFKSVDYGMDVSKKKIPLGKALKNTFKSSSPDIVGISALSNEAKLANEIAIICKTLDRLVWVTVGNHGAERDYSDAVDSFFVGEAIETFPTFCRNSYNARYALMRVIRSFKYFPDLDSLPWIDWTGFDKRHFLKPFDGKVYRGGDHMIGWGCTNSCGYCVNEHWRNLHGGIKGCLRRYSVPRIIEELRFLTKKWNLNFWKFHDEDFLLKPFKYLQELAREYRLNIDLPFTIMANAKSVTEEKAKLLRYMGCVSVSMGIEAGDDNMRILLNRRESPLDIIKAAGIFDKYGIRLSSFNMIGLPYETPETIKKTIELNRTAGIKHPNVSLFIPLEGTRLYDLSVAEGFFKPGSEVSTNKPALTLSGITEEQLIWYYRNFHNLITEGR